MLRVGRSLAMAAWIIATWGAVHAQAQTVIVRNLPPGSPVDFVLNSTVVATEAADAEGIVRLSASADGVTGQQQIDAQVWLDRCGERYRVLVVDRSVVPPGPESCARQQVQGLFLVGRISSLVIDGGSVPPTLRIRQGPAPEGWIRPSLLGDPDFGPERRTPSGLILSGAAGLGSLRDFSAIACGSVSGCDAHDRTVTFAGSVGYWFSPFVGAEVSYVRPRPATASGGGTGFAFDSELDGGLIAFGVKGGLPLGRVRLTMTFGANFQRSTLTTTTTIEPTTVTVDGVEQQIPGGSQTLQWRTEGRDFSYAGGAEVWLSNSVAIYSEVGRHFLKGSDTRDSEARLDDAQTFLLVGIRYRVF
jgi:hypothetical protein